MQNNMQVLYSYEIYDTIVTGVEYTIPSDGTVMILITGTYVFDQKGNIKVFNDENKIDDFELDGVNYGHTNLGHHYNLYISHITSGTHKLSGSLNNFRKSETAEKAKSEYITASTTISVIYLPDKTN